MEIMLMSFNELISKYNMNITGVIHIGAHYGEEVKDYLNNNINDVVLFEPLEENYNIILQNVPDNIIVHNVALGSVPGDYEMFVSSNEKQSSSLLKPKLHLTHHPNVSFPYSTKVKVETLDNYKLQNSYNFINMDVQGYELEVLKGAKETLKHVDYVYCEVNRAEVYENNAFVEEIDSFLSLYDLNRVETSWLGGIWGDALYLKE
jgi:FkbM family methyltransferase